MTSGDPKQIFSPEWLASLQGVLGMIRDFGVEELVLDPKQSRGSLYQSLIPLSAPTSASASPQAQSIVTPTAFPDASSDQSAFCNVPENSHPRRDMNVAPHEMMLPEGVATADAENSKTTCDHKRQQLEELRKDIGDCHRCRLHGGRTHMVFGEGDPMACLMFVGEGPGADEDRLGRPFVGRAGQLLDRMIQAMGLTRERVFIANVVKCRPPGNRTPEPDEADICGSFLSRQIEIIQPELVVCLGLTAAKYVLNTTMSLSSLRGRLTRAHGTRILTTYHPAYLLRQPSAKRDAWEDLQKAMALLGIEAALPQADSE